MVKIFNTKNEVNPPIQHTKEDFIYFSPNDFVIQPGETKKIFLSLYLNRIFFESEKILNILKNKKITYATLDIATPYTEKGIVIAKKSNVFHLNSAEELSIVLKNCSKSSFSFKKNDYLGNIYIFKKIVIKS